MTGSALFGADNLKSVGGFNEESMGVYEMLGPLKEAPAREDTHKKTITFADKIATPFGASEGSLDSLDLFGEQASAHSKKSSGSMEDFDDEDDESFASAVDCNALFFD